MYLFDLVLATRSRNLSGIERYGIALFEAIRCRRSDTIALVSDSSFFDNKDGVVTVPGSVLGWLLLPLRLKKMLTESSVVVCPSFPPSPLFLFQKGSLLRIIHDVFPWDQDRRLPIKGLLAFRYLERALLSRYDFVCGTTSQVSRELETRLGLINVASCGNAAGVDIARLEAEAIQCLVGREYILSVGTVEPRKNYEKVLRIAEECNGRTQLLFVIVGRRGWGESSLTLASEIEGHGTNVLWLRDVSDPQLKWLYEHCKVFLSLSLAEGFNMPLVEAGMTGAHIVCSDIPVHRDVAAPWAEFIDLFAESSAFCDVLKKERPDVDRASHEEYCGLYTWESVARKVEEIVNG
jgi:glycosyltransferase involved in cell wall biosynthesis